MTTTHVRANAGACLGALLALAAFAAPALAQSEPMLADVKVTSERSETVLRKTPLSIGVIGLQDIERRGIYQLNDIVGVVAGVSVPNGYSNMPQAVGIRGVGVSIPAMSQAVGIYIDDVPLVRGYATALWDLPDIERIEVLRGAQGTLYGQNLTAGAVRIISTDPTRERQAWISAGLGNHDTREARGYFTGAVGDGPLNASLAFSRRTNGGLGYNATLDHNVNKLDVSQFRAKFGMAVNSGTRIVLAIDGLQDRSDQNASNFPLNHPAASPRVLFSATDSGAFQRNAGGISLKVDSELDGTLTLRSITALRAYTDDPVMGDWGGLQVARYMVSQVDRQRTFSQELQLHSKHGPWNWTAGAMLVRDQFDFQRFVAALPVSAPPSQTEAQTHLNTTDIGLYGQTRYALNAATGVTVGARIYRTEQSGSNGFWRTNAAQQRTSQVYVASGLSAGKTGLVPKLGVDYQWNPDVLLYGSWARGAKFGGFNRAAESLVSAQVAANPEQVTTWEAGAKGRFADGDLTANLALFHNSYKDYLAGLTNTTVNGVLVTDAVLVNAGRAETYGADLELAVKLGARTDLAVSAEVLRSRFLEFANPTGAAATNYVGHRLPYAPAVSLGSSLNHVQLLDGGSSLAWNLSLQYLGSQYLDVANTAATKLRPQTYVNAGVSWTEASRHWTVALRVRNLMDKTYILLRNRIPSVGVDAAFFNAPRAVLLSTRYDF